MEEKRRLEGKFSLTHGGLRVYEICDLDSKYIFDVLGLISEEFDFAFSQPVFGSDGVYIDFHIQANKLILAWDIWSGLFVMASEVGSNGYVDKIGLYLDGRISEMENWS